MSGTRAAFLGLIAVVALAASGGPALADAGCPGCGKAPRPSRPGTQSAVGFVGIGLACGAMWFGNRLAGRFGGRK